MMLEQLTAKVIVSLKQHGCSDEASMRFAPTIVGAILQAEIPAEKHEQFSELCARMYAGREP